MVQRKPTPEEQLLKLIENSGDAAGKPAEGAKPKGKGPARPSFNVSAAFGRFSGMVDYWKHAFQKKGAAAGPAVQLEAALDIKWINRALIVMVMLTIGYLMIDLTLFKPGRRDLLNQVSVTEPVFPVRNAELSSRDNAFYLEGLRRRNPFLESGTATPVAQEDAVDIPRDNSKVAEMMQGIKLVGISWGDEPLAMVEDTSSGRTYFLKKNQEFRGVKVQEITRERVIVTYEGQEAELI
jgi:hypothetical protein